MGTYVEGQTTISVFVIKMSSTFWWPISIILIPSLICPTSHAEGCCREALRQCLCLEDQKKWWTYLRVSVDFLLSTLQNVLIDEKSWLIAS